MNIKRKRFIALYLAGIGAIGAFASVSAASLSPGTSTWSRDQAHTAIKQAFKVGDYQTFLAATRKKEGDEPLLTEAQFNALVQAQKLRAEGDTEGAKKVLDDAGIKPPMHGKTGKKLGGGMKHMHMTGKHMPHHSHAASSTEQS